MLKRLAFSLAVVMVVLAHGRLSAQVNRSGLIPRTTAQRYGLNRSWFTHVDVDRSRGRVAHLTLHLSRSRQFAVHEITYAGGRLTVSERDADQFGDPIGPAGATKMAEEKMNLLKQTGLDPKMVSRSIPEVTLYAQTDRSVLHAIDGETGRTLWTSVVGNPDHPSLEPSANEDYVAVINGSYLYVVDRTNGKLFWRQQMRNAPGAGPGMSEDIVFVPMVDGTVEGWVVRDHKRTPWSSKSAGRTLVQPTVTHQTVSWPTDRGYLYVSHAHQGRVRYRLESRNSIVAPTTYRGVNNKYKVPMLFAASLDGYVYAMHELSGDIIWRFSTGIELSHSPVPIRDAVYQVTDEGGMFRLNSETGREEWWTPRVSRFLAGNKDRLYCIGSAGRMFIIDAATGGRIDTIPIENLDLAVTNTMTDRIYIGTRTGTIQCLHEPHLEVPQVHRISSEGLEGAAEVVQEGLDEAGDVEQPAGDDPFAGAGGEPFGGADPFGGIGDGAGDDPFGGDAGGGDDNPFGGDDADDNPFGG